MTKDRLFLLPPAFPDPALPAEATWFCADCAMVEGALLANPHWRAAIDIHTISFPRPRADVIALVGEANQDLPLLILGEVGLEPEGAIEANGLRILHGGKAIAAALALRHGGAAPHP